MNHRKGAEPVLMTRSGRLVPELLPGRTVRRHRVLLRATEEEIGAAFFEPAAASHPWHATDLAGEVLGRFWYRDDVVRWFVVHRT